MKAEGAGGPEGTPGVNGHQPLIPLREIERKRRINTPCSSELRGPVLKIRREGGAELQFCPVRGLLIPIRDERDEAHLFDGEGTETFWGGREDEVLPERRP